MTTFLIGLVVGFILGFIFGLIVGLEKERATMRGEERFFKTMVRAKEGQEKGRKIVEKSS